MSNTRCAVNYHFIHSGFHGPVKESTKSSNNRTEGSLVPARARQGELLFIFFPQLLHQKLSQLLFVTAEL